jgi:hypothetical protein
MGGTVQLTQDRTPCEQGPRYSAHIPKSGPSSMVCFLGDAMKEIHGRKTNYHDR